VVPIFQNISAETILFFSWNQFSGRKGWKLNCSKQPKVNIQNWPASILNILSSTGRNCSKQEGTVPNRWHAEWKLNVDSAKTSNTYGWRNCRGGRDAEGTTLTPMPWKLYSKDKYADSSHYATTRWIHEWRVRRGHGRWRPVPLVVATDACTVVEDREASHGHEWRAWWECAAADEEGWPNICIMAPHAWTGHGTARWHRPGALPCSRAARLGCRARDPRANACASMVHAAVGRAHLVSDHHRQCRRRACSFEAMCSSPSTLQQATATLACYDAAVMTPLPLPPLPPPQQQQASWALGSRSSPTPRRNRPPPPPPPSKAGPMA